MIYLRRQGHDLMMNILIDIIILTIAFGGVAVASVGTIIGLHMIFGDNSLTLKLIIMGLVITFLVIASFKTQAGVFLDLDVGMRLTESYSRNCENDPANTVVDVCKLRNTYLGDSNPMVFVRIGYRADEGIL